MSSGKTVSDLFDLACQAERAAADFYYRLSNLFSHVPEVRKFWKMMMQDEFIHAAELTAIRNGMTELQLERPADQATMDKLVEEVSRFAPKFDLKDVETLDDAYEIAYDLEYSEVNTVFKAIVSEYVSSEDRIRFVLAQNGEHVSRLEAFSKSIADPAERCAIRALNPKDSS